MNEQNDRKRFNTILLLAFFGVIVLCVSFCLVGSMGQELFIDFAPIRCNIQRETGLCQ